jgi:TusA-related sulfurtransferase
LALETLDVRGLLCPLPVIRTQDRIRQLSPGTLLEVTATDPGTMEDIPAWCRVHGHDLVMGEALEGDAATGRIYRFTIRISER